MFLFILMPGRITMLISILKGKEFIIHNTRQKVFTLPIEEVHGDFYFGAGMKSGIVANNLKFVDGYMHLKINMMASNLEFSKLEKIGGQFFMEEHLILLKWFIILVI